MRSAGDLFPSSRTRRRHDDPLAGAATLGRLSSQVDELLLMTPELLDRGLPAETEE